MIRYSLKCPDNHSFESWFKSAEAFDSLLAGGMVTCPECGASKVEKAMMAPQVRASRKAATAPEAAPDPRAEAMRELRKQVEANADYVGDKFASEARAMHLGDAPERSIYGEARLDEAKKLIDDGIPIAPLPFAPTRKTN